MSSIPVDILIQLENEKRELEADIAFKANRVRAIQEMIDRANKVHFDWHKISIDTLNKNNDLLTSDEILRNLFWNELEELSDIKKRRKLIQQLSLVLNRLCVKGEIYGIDIDGYKGKVYALKEWVGADGELNTEYQYKYIIKCNKIKNTLKLNAYAKK